MNNLKYYNDSLAYDFERFMPREKREEQIVKMPNPSVKVRRNAKRAARQANVSVTLALAALCLVAALCGNIFLRLEINETNSKINAVKSEIAEMKSVKTGLEVELDRRVAYANIELEAANLGMVKREKDQVKYIRVNDKNAAKIGDEIVVAKNE